MATFNKYHCFTDDLAEAKHDFSSHSFKIALTNRAPVVGSDRLFADIVEIAAGNGYTAGGNAVTLVSSSQTAGVYKAVLNDPATWQASGASMAPFRYAVLYNVTSDLVVAYWDYGLSITLAVGETFIVDLSAANGVFTIT